MVVVLLDAIALTTTIVPPSAKIIWSRRVKFATEIAKPTAMTQMPVRLIPRQVALPHATFNVLIAPFWRASIMTRVAQVVVTPSLTMTANPFVETTC